MNIEKNLLILDTGLIIKLLDTQAAVVLERVARGAGVTNWFVCSGKSCVEKIADKLNPGSLVSFYFDNRIKFELYTPSIRSEITQIINETRDCVVGILQEDGITLNVVFVTNINELEEEQNFDKLTEIYYGPFPSRDNDGRNAITLQIPDSDGVTRPHPY